MAKKVRTEEEQRHSDFRARPKVPTTDVATDAMIAEWLVARLGRKKALALVKVAPDHFGNPGGLYHKFGSATPKFIDGKWCY